MQKILFLLIIALSIHRGRTLKCYNCNGEAWCNNEDILLKVDCSVNYPQTYTYLSRHYGISYEESPDPSQFECFSIDSTLTTILNTENRLVYKGCVEKGFQACALEYDSDIFVNETKNHCKVCSKGFCNKSGSKGVTLSSLALVVLSVITVS